MPTTTDANERLPNDVLTVAELINELLAMPQDLPALVEGCDCEGEARSVRHVSDPHHGPYVLVERHHR